MKRILIVMAAILVMAAPVRAADVSDLEDMIDELDSYIDELELRLSELESRVDLLEYRLPETVTDDEEDVEEDEDKPVIYLVNESGSTEDGDEIIIYCDTPDTTYTWLGLEGWNMDGSLKSFIYVDGELLETAQIADTQMSIGLNGPTLYPGTHEVTIKQYPGNDETAEPSFVQTEEYTVEE